MYSNNRYCGIDRRIISLINKKARSLIYSGFFYAHELEDLEQELLSDLMIEIDRYKPKEQKFFGFIKSAINSKACNLIRDKLTDKRKLSLQMIDVEFDAILEITPDTKHRLSEQLELQMDFDKIMHQLPKELQELCHLLQIMSQRQIAAKTKQSRPQINKKLALLRKAFKETLG